MTNGDPLMDDEQAGDAVAKYLEENPELLQGIVPAHDLWPAIESRISARVIPMSATPRKARRVVGWIPTLIAASALVVGSAGITYVVTTRAKAPVTNSVANSVPSSGNPTQLPSTTVDQHTTQQATQQATQLAQTPSSERTARSNEVDASDNVQVTRPKGPTAQLASRNSEDAGDDARKTYDSEIASLHTTLENRRGQLNPATVAIIEQNLSVIDEAIRQSKAALARDPNSRLLNDQLDRTLAKKTGLLRAAVLLPAA